MKIQGTGTYGVAAYKLWQHDWQQLLAVSLPLCQQHGQSYRRRLGADLKPQFEIALDFTAL